MKNKNLNLVKGLGYFLSVVFEWDFGIEKVIE